MRHEIFLIRHSKTKGNLEGRYIGSRTDEELCDEGITLAKEKGKEILEACTDIDKADSVQIYTSPMKRCVSTAQLIFPEKELITIPELKEIDFGDFENKNYVELNGRDDYQRWIDSGGRMDYPNGEGLTCFINRSMCGFRKVIFQLEADEKESTVIVCHGGNIMAIMSELGIGDYFDFQVKNMEGYRLVVDVRDEDIFVVSHNRI